MTNERAIEILKCNFRGYNDISDEETAISMAVSALEKQIPKKPDYEGDGYDENGELIYDTAYCPVCEHEFEFEINDWGCNFCSDCGQALDWSDEDFNETDYENTDLEKINSYTRSNFDADSLYIFSVSLCNNDIDRDYEKFSLEALEQLKEKFLGKTGIFDHSMRATDQKARIFDTWLERVEGKKTADGEDFYQLKAKAYMVKSEENMPLITDIEAGIKKEVSVSCSLGKSICSICGCDKRNSACEHIRGREYKGKTAYSILSDVKDVYEFSFVMPCIDQNV